MVIWYKTLLIQYIWKSKMIARLVSQNIHVYVKWVCSVDRCTCHVYTNTYKWKLCFIWRDKAGLAWIEISIHLRPFLFMRSQSIDWLSLCQNTVTQRRGFHHPIFGPISHRAILTYQIALKVRLTCGFEIVLSSAELMRFLNLHHCELGLVRYKRP